MTDWTMFSKIHALKSKGFNKSHVAKELSINFRTVDKHWDMTPKEYEDLRVSASKRIRQPDVFRTEMIDWLRKHPDMSSAQVFDWLQEKHGLDIGFSERTARRYICQLREEEDIPKTKASRQYEAVDDPPLGYQCQVDMGETWMLDDYSKRHKLYCFAMVMSNSRHKYVHWQERPFTAYSFIDAHEKAFHYFGGRPKEIVYDQDVVLSVSENNGDIIHTEAFQSYISVVRFKVYLCRGNDPESKGRIEAVVKFVKNSFAKDRTFTDIDALNHQCLKWLDRRGNGKRHGTTQKIPAEVFALEQDYLTPVSSYEVETPKDSVTYQVRKDNTVLYRSNRYRVPKGTYRPGLEVKLKINGSTLLIVDIESEIIYARHMLCLGRGELVGIKKPNRELTKMLFQLENELLEYFDNKELLKGFILNIREDKPRYIRDQLGIIRGVCEHPSLNAYIDKALEYCVRNNIRSASDFRAATEYLYEINKAPVKASPKPYLSDKCPLVNPKIRSIDEYKKVMEA